LIAAAPVAAMSQGTAAAAPAAAVIDPDALLLFSVDLQGLTVTEGLAAYGAPDDPLIPIAELTRLLELDVDVHPSERRITGRIGEARRALVVDLGANLARIGPQEVTIAAGDFAVTPSEIYARKTLLEQLLPLKISVDENQLTLSVTPTEKRPYRRGSSAWPSARRTASRPRPPKRS